MNGRFIQDVEVLKKLYQSLPQNLTPIHREVFAELPPTCRATRPTS
ncbi:hypothetical protein [Leptospira interrogans]|nr:hypothetical protein [Leptospira interrogans]